MSHKKKRVAQNRQKKQLRRKNRARQSRRLPLSKLSPKRADRLDDAYDSIRSGDYDEAEEILGELDSRGASYPEVVEALMTLYQRMGDHEGCCEAAERLTRLRPHDADAHIMYAQESMYGGRASIALASYQEFVERWPDHPHVSKAKELIEVLVSETERRIAETSFPPEKAFELYCLHEESLACLARGKYTNCIAKCEELLANAPDFVSARNNLTVAYFQAGKANEAITVVEETRRRFPDNDFAKGTMAKLYFLSGRSDDAHQLAEEIANQPPTEEDAIVATLEMLAFLGRDDDVIQLAETANTREPLSEDIDAIRLHYLAYARCRLGDEKAAKAAWKRSAKLFDGLPEASRNLIDLELSEGHAPWAASFAKWVPRETVDRLFGGVRDEKALSLAAYPDVASIIPALLDRGDPIGREAAMRLAMADRSPPMLDALKDFAFGSRGPDKMRLDALRFLREESVVDAEPHRVYLRGEWTDIQVFAAEISGEPQPASSSPHVLDLLEEGFYAMRARDFDKAEAVFTEAIAEEPDNCSAVYNLCAAWMNRDGEEGQRRATPRLEQLHREHPEYAFAAIALAQFAADAGDFDGARDLLAPCMKMKRMHTSEATALLGGQIHIALAENDIDAAEQTFEMLETIADESDPLVGAIRRRIDQAAGNKGLMSLLSQFEKVNSSFFKE